MIKLIKGPVSAMQTAACWVVNDQKEETIFATNTDGNTITSFTAGKNGNFNVAIAAIPSGENSVPFDAVLSKGDRFWSVLNSGDESISSFKVKDNGNLQFVDNVYGLKNGATGLASN